MFIYSTIQWQQVVSGYKNRWVCECVVNREIMVELHSCGRDTDMFFFHVGLFLSTNKKRFLREEILQKSIISTNPIIFNLWVAWSKKELLLVDIKKYFLWENNIFSILDFPFMELEFHFFCDLSCKKRTPHS